jgi:hypothetical protein
VRSRSRRDQYQRVIDEKSWLGPQARKADWPPAAGAALLRI